VKLEEQLLPDAALAPLYDKAVWVYVYRTFKKDEEDRLAERISLRFGVTSWPQLFLADPQALHILRHTGRTKESFHAAFAETDVGKAADTTAHARLQAAEKRAIALEKKPTRRRARKGLDDEDIVVRVRAVEFLAKDEPAAIVKRAKALLAVPNDPLRYEVCRVLAAARDSAAADALEGLVREPKDSLNPNVLRIRAVQALATCGDAGSVAAIAPHAATGAYFNGLTGIAVDALAAIAARDPEAHVEVRKALTQAYPPPPAEGDARALRACIALAKRVHKALGRSTPFPDVYDEAAREALKRSEK
jgi:hypothetical protein